MLQVNTVTTTTMYQQQQQQNLEQPPDYSYQHPAELSSGSGYHPQDPNRLTNPNHPNNDYLPTPPSHHNQNHHPDAQMHDGYQGLKFVEREAVEELSDPKDPTYEPLQQHSQFDSFDQQFSYR